MNVAVVGSRNFKELYKVDGYLNDLKQFLLLNNPDEPLHIITGGAFGVDKRAEAWCKKNTTCCQVIRPIKPTPAYFLYRNVEILTKADRVVAFWDGRSGGTKFVIDYCKARYIPLEVVRC